MGSKESFYLYATALHPAVTGSCIPVYAFKRNRLLDCFLCDCGIFQERNYEELNYEDFPFDSEKIHFVVITHNHADHVGRLPLLYKYGFKGLIYATDSTCKLLKISLENTKKIMVEDAKRSGEKPLYDEDDVDMVLENLVPCQIDKTIQVSEYIKMTFIDNGHINGAAMICMQFSYPGEEDTNLLCTGDYKPTNMFKQVRPIPQWVYELPMNVIIESTYGDTESSEIEHNFEDDVQKILKDGQSLFIPVLAQGRAQEVLYTLKMMQDAGKISKSIPIYLDGNLAHQYTRIYASGELEIDKEHLKFLPDNFHFVDKENRELIKMDGEQKIILTTSGMLDHGPARLYLPGILGSKRWAIFLTSYCSEGTLGRKLIDKDILSEETICVMGVYFKLKDIKAQIFSTSQFSSHAKADELEELLSRFKDLKLVMVNHGEKEVQSKFVTRIENKGIAKRVESLSGYTIKFAHYGYIKSMSSKLYNINSKKSMIKQKQAKNNKKKQNTRNPGKVRPRRISCRRKSICN